MQPANQKIRGARIVLVAGQQCRFRLVLLKGTRLAMRPRNRVQECKLRDTVLRRT